MIYLNTPYKCRHCETVYAILHGSGYGSFLPVEIINGKEHYDGEFDKTKHVSHLLNCPKLQEQWNDVKNMINAEMRRKGASI